MKNFFTIILFVIFIIFNSILNAKENDFFQSVPKWVIDKSFNKNAKIPFDEINGGTFFLLANTQIKIDKLGEVNNYRHIAMKIVNSSGLEGSSHLNFRFDPTYEKIFINKLFVWRNGKKIDKSFSSKISILQREKELEKQIYSGKKTLNILLDDIRVGDIIEYSYTRIGQNPVYKKIFSYTQDLKWAVPVKEQYFRILWGKSKELNYKLYNTNIKLNKKQTLSGYEYWLEQKNISSLEVSDYTPKWYDPYPYIQFSEILTWSEVIKWGNYLHKDVFISNDELRTIAYEIRKSSKDKKEWIASALKYVQMNIRYLGIEIGVNSHIPHTSDITLKRRYGDCKDKSVLLITLLKELEIEAYPVLVNTRLKHTIIDRLPSIASFNHEIVLVKFNEKNYWLDPTRQYQYDKLDSIFQPDYGYALVLDSKVKELVSMKSQNSNSKKNHIEIFDLPKVGNENANFTLKTEYYGLDAEYIRSDLEDKGLNKLQKDYLDYYKGYYPSVEILEKLEVLDSKYPISLKEKYIIKDFWIKNESKNRYEADFYSNAVSSYLDLPKNLNYKEPIYLSYPLDVKQSILVNFKEEDWKFDNSDFVEENKFFYFSQAVKYNSEKRQLFLEYHYKSKVSFVLVNEIEEYSEAVEKARKKLNYGIYSSIIDSNNIIDKFKDFQTIAIFVYIIILVSLLVIWMIKFVKKTDLSLYSYYPVSFVKFIFMSILTLGVYISYWFWMNFRYIKKRDDSNIFPFLRGFFSFLFYYPLYSDLLNDSTNRKKEKLLPKNSVAIIFAIIFFVSIFIVNVSDSYLWILIFLITILLVLPLLKYINHINGRNKAYEFNSKISFRHYILAIFISIPLYVLFLGQTSGILPSGKIIPGEDLLSFNKRFMYKNKILKNDDKLIYFYSNATFDIKSDGNGLTSRHVFTYWIDENKQFNYKEAKFSDIKDINVKWADLELLDITYVEIEKKDGDSFTLYLSAEDKKDKLFVDTLMEKWKLEKD